jgi:hypothetical protein
MKKPLCGRQPGWRHPRHPSGTDSQGSGEKVRRCGEYRRNQYAFETTRADESDNGDSATASEMLTATSEDNPESKLNSTVKFACHGLPVAPSKQAATRRGGPCPRSRPKACSRSKSKSSISATLPIADGASHGRQRQLPAAATRQHRALELQLCGVFEE